MSWSRKAVRVVVKIQVSQLVVHTYTSSLSCLRVKAGLKLHTEADKRTVQQGVHLLQDPEGKGLGEGGGRRVWMMFSWYCIIAGLPVGGYENSTWTRCFCMIVYTAATAKVRAAQKERRARKSRVKVAEMETEN